MRAVTSISCARRSVVLTPASSGSITRRKVGGKALAVCSVAFLSPCANGKIENCSFLKCAQTWNRIMTFNTTESRRWGEEVKAPNQIGVQNNKVMGLLWSNSNTRGISTGNRYSHRIEFWQKLQTEAYRGGCVHSLLPWHDRNRKHKMMNQFPSRNNPLLYGDTCEPWLPFIISLIHPSKTIQKCRKHYRNVKVTEPPLLHSAPNVNIPTQRAPFNAYFGWIFAHMLNSGLPSAALWFCSFCVNSALWWIIPGFGLLAEASFPPRLHRSRGGKGAQSTDRRPHLVCSALWCLQLPDVGEEMSSCMCVRTCSVF